MKNYISKYSRGALNILIKIIKSPVTLLIKLKNADYKKLLKSTLNLFSFMLLLITFLTSKFLDHLTKYRFFPKVLDTRFRPRLTKIAQKVYQANRYKEITINRVNLIELSIQNMMFKKSRTMITIGGMAVGIAAIVFLVSIGYGLEQLVISRVARLEEMRQIDVTPQVGSDVNITDQSISQIKDVAGVEEVHPLIAVVGRVNFQNSVTDVAVYGVTSGYLTESAIQPVEGEIFDSNELSTVVSSGDVAGAEVERARFNQTIQEVEFDLYEGVWIPIYEAPRIGSDILGFTRRSEGVLEGEQVWGSVYENLDPEWLGIDINGIDHAKWVSSKFYGWERVVCELDDEECESGYFELKDDTQSHAQLEGYITQNFLTISASYPSVNNVLGQSTQVLADDDVASSEADLVSTSSATLDDGDEVPEYTIDEDGFVVLNEDSETAEESAFEKVDLPSSAYKEVVINRALLQVLGIDEGDAVGKEFNISFVVGSDLLSEGEKTRESNPVSYTIVGVVPDEEAPFVYVPFIDVRSLGIVNYSQVNVVTKDQNSVPNARKSIEAMGFETASVVDTVAQIDRLFATARLILATVGMVALSVAALGMFNTMSVSLLERTREVGLMKAMGMKSHEVRELFLTESMTMGFFGGLMGIAMGVLFGKLLGFAISALSIVKGAGYIDISYLPPLFMFFIIFLSVVVGLITGIYPARRATKISALNALRYE